MDLGSGPWIAVIEVVGRVGALVWQLRFKDQGGMARRGDGERPEETARHLPREKMVGGHFCGPSPEVVCNGSVHKSLQANGS